MKTGQEHTTTAADPSPPRPGWWERVLFAGCVPEDDAEQRRQKAVMTGTALVKCSVCPVWWGAYFLVGAPLAALGPLAYQLATFVSVALFFRRKNFAAFRTRQTAAILLGPWYMHVALGGFAGSAGVLLWAILAPLTALLFHGARQSVPWLLAYLGVIALSAAIESSLPFPPADIGPTISRVFLALNLMIPSIIAYLAVRYFAYLIELDKRVQDRQSAEIRELNRRLAADNVRLGSEIEVARRLQMMVLPQQDELNAVPDLDISAYMRPADEVGGDYYDVLRLGGRIKIGMGDVTGHGLESGVVMLMVQSVARTLLDAGEYDPVRFLAVLNQVIYKNVRRIRADKNLTLAFVDFTGDRVQLSGQHEEVLVLRADGTVERIDTIDLGFPIGLEPDIRQFVQAVDLRFGRGDCLVLYTDGVTEAENAAGELFGSERLCESLLGRRTRTAAEIQAGVVDDLMRFIGGHRIHDDISLMVVRYP